MRTWTPEAKAAQRAAIARWKPWTKSTGPRTQAGKARSAANACKGDTICKLHKELTRLGGRQGRILRAIELIPVLSTHPSRELERTIIIAELVMALEQVATETREWFSRLLRLKEAPASAPLIFAQAA